MIKSICAIVALLLAVQAQVTPPPNLPYSQVLDANYKVSWGLTNDTVEMQLDVNARGWVSFAIISDDGKMLDIWWGGYDEDYEVNYGQVKSLMNFLKKLNQFNVLMLQDAYAEYNNLQPGPRYPDTLQNLNLISVIQSPFNGTTRIRFSRQFNTPDFKQDVSIPYVSSTTRNVHSFT